MNKIEISLQDLFGSDVSLETVGLKTGISSVLLDEYRRGLKSWRKMPLDVALRLTDYWNSREDVLSKYQRVILMNQLTLIQAFRKCARMQSAIIMTIQVSKARLAFWTTVLKACTMTFMVFLIPFRSRSVDLSLTSYRCTTMSGGATETFPRFKREI